MCKYLVSCLLMVFVFAANSAQASPYASNRLFQKWTESEVGFASQIDNPDFVKPGNGRNFAWTQIVKVRSYGEMYKATGDTVWLSKMRDSLDVIEEFKEDSIQCYGYTLKGWRDTSKVNDQQLSRYFPVHQGRILTGYLEFTQIIYDNQELVPEFGSKADQYLALADEVITSLNNLYRTESVNGQTVGYYLYPKQDKVDCWNVTEQRIGPHNQSLAVGTALNLMHASGLTGYVNKIEQLANGIKTDLISPANANHYEWPYWPSFSGASSTKAEDAGHAQLDVEFIYLTYKNGLGSITKSDMARLAATLVDVLDRGADFFAFRVDGSLNNSSVLDTQVKNLSKTNDMRAGWVLFSDFNANILEIAERWCVNNTSHANATLFRMGGQGMGCPGWCPKANATTFDAGDANGWQAGHPQCNYPGAVIFDDETGVSPQHDPTARLKARRGRGLIYVAEDNSSNHNCDVQHGDVYKDISIYKDIPLTGLEDMVELAGFTRSLSSNSNHASITNRSVFAVEPVSGLPLDGSLTEKFSNSDDSGWLPFNLKVDADGATSIRAILGMNDSWSTNWNQQLRADELRVCTAAYCGDGICSVGETVASCALDCDSNAVNNEFDFESGAQGWQSADTTSLGYAHPVTAGKLIAFEQSVNADHSQDETLAATAGQEMAWYQNFANDSDLFVVGGKVKVSSQYQNSSTVNHFCVTLLDAGNPNFPELAKRCSVWTFTPDSGWFDFEYDFSNQVQNINQVRVVLGVADNWSSNWQQRLEIDSVSVTGPSVAASVCGNNICELDETPLSCSADCGLPVLTANYDFESGAQGWLNTNSSGYSYPLEGGELVSEETSGGQQQPDGPVDAAGMELNWYKDFAYTSGPFSLAGSVRVSSDYSGNSKVTRYCVVLAVVENGTVTELANSRVCQHFTNTTDSGWQVFNQDFSAIVPENTMVRVIVGSPDSWSRNWSQKVRIDDLTVTYGYAP